MGKLEAIEIVRFFKWYSKCYYEINDELNYERENNINNAKKM